MIKKTIILEAEAERTHRSEDLRILGDFVDYSSKPITGGTLLERKFNNFKIKMILPRLNVFAERMSVD